MAIRTVTALFDTYDAASSAVTKLEATGFPHSDISIVSNDESHRQYHDDAGAAGTGTGASLGTVLGGGAGLLAGLGLLAIPGLGPVVAAGWLASTLVGAGIGAAAGGVIGALTDAGVSHADAHVYAEGVRRGGTLVTVKSDERLTDQAVEILDRDGTVDLDQRQATWRNEGWTGEFAAAAPSVAAPPAPGLSGSVVGPSASVLTPDVSAAATSATDVSSIGTPVLSSRHSRVRVYDNAA